MNILPKKSWHVRTKANIERVRRDEAKAAEEEKEKQRRIAVAEQEARTALLRQRAEQRAVPSASGQPVAEKAESSPSKEVIVFEGGKHINFWSEFEEGKPTSGGNEEYEREKKQEQEKQEQAVGLLTYLGQSSAERLATKPWYQQPRERREHKQEDTDRNKKEDEIDRKRKLASDPMRTMSNYLEKKRKVDERDKPTEKHKDKKHKHKHSHKESKKSSGSKTMEQLRAERLQREKAERAKAEALMSKLRGEKTETEPKVELDERQRGYNSQFNPDFVRKYKTKHSYH